MQEAADKLQLCDGVVYECALCVCVAGREDRGRKKTTAGVRVFCSHLLDSVDRN